MAMNAAVLKTAMKAALIATFTAWEGATLTDLADPAFNLDTAMDKFADAISSTVVAHIAANAQATGVDAPTGDTHTLAVA